jgi:hypothetical protein
VGSTVCPRSFIMTRCVLYCLLLWSGIFLLSSQYGLAQPGSGIRGNSLDIDINGRLFVLDREKCTLRQYVNDTLFVREIGGPGWENDQFDMPAGLWARNGIDLFVADYGNHRIQRFDRSLSFVGSFSTRESDNPDERFGYPTDVALSRLGDLFICDTENTRIVKVNRFSRVERVFGGFDAGKGRLRDPSQLEVGPRDHVYVLDAPRILIFDTFGNYLGDLAGGLFKNPSCLYADGDGVVVCDEHALYCFDQNGRPAASVPLDSLLGSSDLSVRSLAFSKTTLYLLTSGGLITAPSPRPSAIELR